MQDFTKKHLKALANDVNINKAIDNLRNEVTDAAMKQVATATNVHSWNKTWKLNPSVVSDIASSARTEVRAAHDEAIREAVATLKERYTDAFVAQMIERHLKDTIEAQVKAGVAKRLKEISEGLAKA